MKKTFNLTNYPHQKVLISFVIYFLDYWEGEELYLKIDDQIVQSFQSKSKSDHILDFCGNFTYDKNDRFSIEFLHIKRELTIELVPFLNESIVFENISRSYGISEISLDLIAECQINSKRINETSCECLNGYYKKNRDPCFKLGFEKNFCFDCLACPVFCKTCENELSCMVCREGLSNINGLCITPNGNTIKIIYTIIYI